MDRIDIQTVPLQKDNKSLASPAVHKDLIASDNNSSLIEDLSNTVTKSDKEKSKENSEAEEKRVTDFKDNFNKSVERDEYILNSPKSVVSTSNMRMYNASGLVHKTEPFINR